VLRRWPILLAMLAVPASIALATGGPGATASASTPAVTHPAVNPGGVARLIGPASDVTGAISQASSTNWAGYADTAGTYTSVAASWTQPAGTCSTSGDQYAAFWIGIDGYSSATVEQIGTDTDCIGKTAEYYAWYELYPGPSEDYSSTVKAGDHLNASVTYEGSNKFSLHIADTTQGWTHTTTATLADAARSSAEVIVEAPCCTASGGILPLADFGSVSFTGATANGEPIGTPALDPVQINMVGVTGDKLTCSGLTNNGENFTCTWARGA
jgi:hypothetical protein